VKSPRQLIALVFNLKKLNASKGPAVWSSRAQVDMNDYPAYMRSVVEKQNNLTVVEGEAIGFIIKAGKIQGLKLNKNRILKTKKVILSLRYFFKWPDAYRYGEF